MAAILKLVFQGYLREVHIEIQSNCLITLQNLQNLKSNIGYKLQESFQLEGLYITTLLSHITAMF